MADRRPRSAPALHESGSVAPGPWLRLTALGASGATLLAVVSGAAGLDTAHRLLAALALPPLVAIVVAAWSAHRRLLPPAASALGAFGVAALVTEPTLHVAAAGLACAVTVVVTALVFRGAPAANGSLRDHVVLTKPRIMSLLLVTGAGGAFVGAGGLPPPATLGVALLGLALACGGASALNHVLDADIDRLMGTRTASRPVAAGRMPPSHALEFGLALSALSFVLLASLVNVLTATLALVGNLFYVLVYTRWLKRTTPQNIVIGGAAGAVPPLVGYAATSGNVSVAALLLFAIVFFWTPPHFWALALLIKDAYAAARVPMLPVVRGEPETARQIVRYSVVLVGVSLLPVLWGTLGWFYLGAALALGGYFCLSAWRLLAETTPARASRLFHYSLLYLALLFVAMSLDPILL